MKIESKKIMAMFLAATLTAGGAYTGFIDTEKIGIDNAVVEAHAGTYRDFTYIEKPDGTLEISRISYSAGGRIRVPSTIDGKNVTSIGVSAFRDRTEITSVILPEGMLSIENNAFAGCKGITTINIPSSVKNIGDSAFWECQSIESLTLNEGVTNIGDNAFWGCENITSVTIPESVENIGKGVFNACIKLNSIDVNSNNKNYIDIDGVLFTKDCKSLIS